MVRMQLQLTFRLIEEIKIHKWCKSIELKQSYTRPYWGKVISRLNYIDKLSPQAKVRYKAINLYSSGDYSLKQICEIFEVNRSTFYRWRKKYIQSRIQSLEDRSRRPQRLRAKVVRNH